MFDGISLGEKHSAFLIFQLIFIAEFIEMGFLWFPDSVSALKLFGWFKDLVAVLGMEIV